MKQIEFLIHTKLQIKIYPEIKEFLEKDSTVNFLIAAKNFVELLEIETIEPVEFYSKAHNFLLELYLAGQKLEIINLKYSSLKNFDNKTIYISQYKNKISTLKEKAFYWEIFDPTYTETDGKPDSGWEITDKEAMQGWLVDDFSDIYRDIKTELRARPQKLDKFLKDFSE